MAIEQHDARAKTWLSIGLAQLANELALGSDRAEPQSSASFDFDVLIVGSGYGGSIVLDELAGYAVDGHALRIAMLERGQEYVPGTFASAGAELPGQVRLATSGASAVSGKPEGLFDVRRGSDVSLLVASGLGGGSLINAGVMMPPNTSVLQNECWPRAIRTESGWPKLFDEIRCKLMANSSSAWQNGRTRAMDRLSHGGTSARGRSSSTSASEPVFITVATKDEPGLGISACNSCGDCATGCNFGAKISVDVSLIAQARRRHPCADLRVVTDATVVCFEAARGGGWAVDVAHTASDLRRHQSHPYRVFARKLVVAAGTLGSTELLMRARAKGLSVSDKLGSGFSGNGDMIFAASGLPFPVNDVADETMPFANRNIGPTITRMVDCRGDGDLDAVIQDLAVPGGLRRVFEECVAMSSVVSSLGASNTTTYTGRETEDSAGLSSEATAHMLALAVIADDGARGSLTLPPATGELEQGTLGVVWRELRQAHWPERCQAAVDRRLRETFPGAALQANPAWRPLSPALEQLFGRTRGPTLSVHPLGGCAMAEDLAHGVVDDLGRVFRRTTGKHPDRSEKIHHDARKVHDDLVILDGAIVPMALGINPALTISALALRAIRHLRDHVWNFLPAGAAPTDLPARPRFATPEPVRSQDTVLEIAEKLKATIQVASPQGARTLNAELELWFKPIGIGDIIAADGRRALHVDPSRSRLLLRPPPTPVADCAAIDGEGAPGANPNLMLPCLEAPLSGTLTLMRHEPSFPLLRRVRAIAAWFFNRGLRDIVQRLQDWLLGRPTSMNARVWQLAKSLWRTSSHAGDARLMSYDMKIGEPVFPTADSLGGAEAWRGHLIRAVKRLTYECSANPSVQLSSAQVTAFPNWAGGVPDDVLRVDPSFWVTTGVPLLRITSQRDSPSALQDLASLTLYMARTILPLHFLTLRLPDRPNRAAARLPADLSPLRPFPRLEYVELEVARHSSGGVVNIRLSRYRPDAVTQPNPVVLIHGYSASGTTFVHEALPGGGLVGALCGAGHDVWVLDLRSSAGMPTAEVDWKFEDMGQHDIPMAVSHVLERTGATKVDIVAHCMGAAMLSLGLLMPVSRSAGPHTPPNGDPARALREHLGRVVLSQVGPTLVVTPGNSARAYIIQWLRHYMRLGRYVFTPASPTAVDDMFDRLLCALPCPKPDFALENPFFPPGKRTPWVGARHRMDALYGRTFQLEGLDEGVLGRIDDFFGPLNLQTLAQVISFARCNLVTDVHGDSSFVQARRLAAYNGSQVLSLHSRNNGLFDFQTRANALELFRRAGLRGWSFALDDMGHQDSLIGREAPRVYDLIRRFLAGEDLS